MLSDRRQRVLSALIEEYVARALPVGSRTLTERYQLGVSSATVRNELSVLEDGGYILQPHTSAGRVPTDYGYRAFVDNLIDDESIQDDEACNAAAEQLRQSASEMDELLEQTSRALTRFTDCLSIVMAPAILKVGIKQISLVSLTAYRALVVLITEDGRVFNRQMDFSDEVPCDELARVQSEVSSMLCGKSVQEVGSSLSEGMLRGYADPLLRFVLDEVLDCIQEGMQSKAYRLGVSSLMSKPEFSQTQSLLPVMQVLEDETVLLQILDDAANASGDMPSVKIGHENDASQFSGVSVVASKYGTGKTGGIVAVIGPTRMDYSKVIQAVRIASSALGDR